MLPAVTVPPLQTSFPPADTVSTLFTVKFFPFISIVPLVMDRDCPVLDKLKAVDNVAVALDFPDVMFPDGRAVAVLIEDAEDPFS